MANLYEQLSKLETGHQRALEWFYLHQGQEISWPKPMPGGIFLMNKAKGIHKPAGWKYALSVRQSLDTDYPDVDPEYAADGSWTYKYHQEGLSPGDRDRFFTNRSLMECLADGIPVGVLRQTQRRPAPKYKILGLAQVLAWDGGTFTLKGLPADGGFNEGRPSPPNPSSVFNPASLEDARKWVLASIVRRQGQGVFRAKILAAYKGCCAISDCNTAATLEAAHIIPYLGPDTNTTANGILLRADIHTLFDLGLIAIDIDDMSLLISSSLIDSHYQFLAKARLKLPEDRTDWPSLEALKVHRNFSRL